MFGGIEGTRRGRFLVPVDEILKRLPGTMAFGVIAGLLYYAIGSRRPTVVCPKCSLVGYASESAMCKCGGRPEDIEEMKWVPEKKK